MRSRTEVVRPVPEEIAPPEVRELARPSLLEREVVHEPERYQLTANEAKILHDVGRFRTVLAVDIRRFTPRLDRRNLDQALRSLLKRKLLERRTLSAPGRKRLEVLTLSPAGQKVIEQATEGSRQRFYSKLVKLREIEHDTAVYLMFQEEAKRIEKEGGSVHRVVLDYELKSGVFFGLEKGKGRSGQSREELQAEVASRFQLQVVDGKIPLPDLRLEYRTKDGAEAHVDLELSTGHYKASQLARKTRAGFRVYHLSPGGRSRLGGTPRGEEILREVLSR